MKQIMLGLPPELVDALEHLGGRNEDAIGDIIRDALRHDLRRRVKARGQRMARMLAPLQANLSDDLADAADWDDLQSRVRRHGYQFVRCGGGLSLLDLDGTYVCSASDLGHSLAQFMRRFRAPVPAAYGPMAMAS